MSDLEDSVQYNTLIDSGASRPFVDFSIAEKHPENLTPLEQPIGLDLFDGKPSSAGRITHSYRDTISFDDGTIHLVEFLVTRLHPAAPIVLGLSWLQKHNPVIDWKDLSIMFQDRKVRISAALAGNLPLEEHFARTSLEGGVKFPKLPPEKVPEPQFQSQASVHEAKEPTRSRKSSVTVEEVMDEDSEPANKPIPLKASEENENNGPILMAVEEILNPVAEGINEWLEMADWMEGYVADS